MVGMIEKKSAFPQILLMGNGLNRAFGGESWDGLIESINKRDDIDTKKLNEHGIPFPMQAILVTNNNIKAAMQEKKDSFWGEIKTPGQAEALKELLSMGFDDILTTNYSYELEAAALGIDKVSKYRLEKMSKSTKGKVEPRYLLHTYNSVEFAGHNNRIWHIHGESRKPDSMILGHYWYASQLSKMKEESDKSEDSYQRSQRNGTAPKLDSWVDSFILGDVYILGFGCDLSEIDLWWIINRKKREKAEHGKIYFYEMKDERQYEKTVLLDILGVEVVNLGMDKPQRDDPNSAAKYKTFYTMAIRDIKSKMRGNSHV